ncbi:DNA methyltransferase [Hydromonas duriensis]|uniref:Methyltransferase n=1 Tax=Hydromonas duriensis TaxID=1527608 RepID=A0A4R6Y721_9BURK|nr:DNA methyltransferase [Hydromonas duriensis]TDR30666.1 site-specific DNA-methyltransferase (adenine-specific) [Hydromonas duriensis]
MPKINQTLPMSSFHHDAARIHLYQMDCMAYMAQFPDGYFDLAIVDPPYGLPKTATHGRGKLKSRLINKDNISRWDVQPPAAYFEELFRVSKQQIIWGGNYFNLRPTRCVIAWDKCQPWPNFSQVELGWTSFNKPAPLFKCSNRKGKKIHPTQKPIELYEWQLNKFARAGDKILDTHLGSASSAIAAYKLGFEFHGTELDEDYFNSSVERFKQAMMLYEPSVWGVK